MRHYRDDPREIQARFDSTCAETGKPIEKGQTCIYYPRSKKVYHLESNQAREFYEWKMDMEITDSNIGDDTYPPDFDEPSF